MADTESAPEGGQHPKPLGQKLLDSGLITPEQLTLALHEQRRRKTHLGEALVTLGFISDDMLSSLLAQEMQAETADLSGVVIDHEVLRLVPINMAKRYLLVPLSRDGHVLSVAMADPFNVMAIDTVEKATGLSLDVSAASEQAIREVLERQYVQSASMEQTLDELMRQSHEQLEDEAGGESSMIRLVDQIIAQAIKSRATDIHVEPDSSVLRLRMRVDGVMQQRLLIPKPMQAAVTARLKIMAGMDVTEKRLPQDGRIAFHFSLREVDLRVSTMPTCHGENLVLRVLDRDETTMNIKALGMPKAVQGMFEASLARPQGLILVTGPTGSGKTTTLYSAMNHVSSIERSVFTLEDPIEYRMPLIRQTQINPVSGMTFPAGLRAVLRQDPDVILVGEIRDAETAKLAVRAAMTGHLVLATLHTNDAAASIQRLADMGAEPYLLAPTLAAVLAQRLVRSICPACIETVDDAEERLAAAGVNRLPDGMPTRLWRGAGCAACDGTGYLGRTAVFELLRIDDAMQEAIMQGGDAQQMRRLAADQGMMALRDAAILKVLRGETTLDEALRVTA